MRRVPLPFALALAGGATAAFALLLARGSTRRDPADLHSFAADVVTAGAQGVAILVGALLVVGTLALRRRDPAPQVGVLLAGAIVLLVAAIARPIGEQLIFARLPDHLAVLEGRRWIGRLDTTGAVAFAAGLVFLGEHSERVRSLTVPLLVLAIAAHPPRMIADELARMLGDVPGKPSVWKAAFGYGAIQVAFAVVALAALAAALRPSEPHQGGAPVQTRAEREEAEELPRL